MLYIFQLCKRKNYHFQISNESSQTPGGSTKNKYHETLTFLFFKQTAVKTVDSTHSFKMSSIENLMTITIR